MTIYVVLFRCGHCKSFQPQYDKAATALKGVAVVAAVDADAHKSLGAEYGVQGFPTIKAFIPGQKKPIDYQGAREAKPMVDWVLQQVTFRPPFFKTETLEPQQF